MYIQPYIHLTRLLTPHIHPKYTLHTPYIHHCRYGKDLPVKVAVHMPSGASVESNQVTFSYDPPVINLLTSKW